MRNNEQTLADLIDYSEVVAYIKFEVDTEIQNMKQKSEKDFQTLRNNMKKKPKMKNMQHLMDTILTNKDTILIPLTEEFDKEYNVGSYCTDYEKQWILNNKNYCIMYKDFGSEFYGFADDIIDIKVISKIDAKTWQLETVGGNKFVVESKSYCAVNRLSLATKI